MTHPNAVAYPAIHSVWSDSFGMQFSVTNTAQALGYVWARRLDSPFGTEGRWGIHEWLDMMTPKAAQKAA